MSARSAGQLPTALVAEPLATAAIPYSHCTLTPPLHTPLSAKMRSTIARRAAYVISAPPTRLRPICARLRDPKRRQDVC